MSADSFVWEQFEAVVKMPCSLKLILSMCGYDNELCLRTFVASDIKDIENYMNDTNSYREISDNIYRKQKTFQILPGHQKMLLEATKRFGGTTFTPKCECGRSSARFRDAENEASTVTKPTKYSAILQELINSADTNTGKPPEGRRYSDNLQNFSRFIYMLCGKLCYEFLSANLPLPAYSSIG